MAPAFKTYQEAYDAGYTKAGKHNGTDISGPGSFGYAFESADGTRSVDCYFSEEKNRLNRKGCFNPMFPPTE